MVRVVGLLLSVAAAGAAKDDLGVRVAAARAKAVAFLRAQQDADGSWGGTVAGSFTWGTALNLYALASAGVPADDPTIRRGVRFLELHAEAFAYGAPHGVEAAAMTVLALARIDRRRFDGRIRALTERIVRSQKDPGSWDFPLGRFSTREGEPGTAVRTGRGYGTQTMVAVHALLEGGAPVPERTWSRVRRYYERRQSGTGGWREFSSLRRDGALNTAAGVVGLLGAGGRPDSRVVKRGLEALDAIRARTARACRPRLAFTLVRAARAAGMPAEAWDIPIARRLLRAQRPDGAWGIRARHGVASHAGETAYALLSLSHVRTPAPHAAAPTRRPQ